MLPFAKRERGHVCSLSCVLSRTMHRETIIRLLTLLFSKQAYKIMINYRVILIYTHLNKIFLGQKFIYKPY